MNFLERTNRRLLGQKNRKRLVTVLRSVGLSEETADAMVTAVANAVAAEDRHRSEKRCLRCKAP
mgnify:CR=1 FL=1